MGRLVLIAMAAGTLLAATPALAQVGFGAGPGGAGVQVGPFGFGVGPAYDYGYDYGYPRYRDRYWDRGYGYAPPGGCREVRERTTTPGGRVIIRRHRECD